MPKSAPKIQTHDFDKLTYESFGDFTGGLWERQDDRECPRNGLLSCVDAYPLPTGGLRAWGTWQPMTQTGLPTNAYILGIWCFGGVDSTAGIYSCTLECDPNNIDNSTFRLHRLSGSLGSGNYTEATISTGTWTTLQTITGIASFGAWTQLTPYRFSTGTINKVRIWFNVGFGSSLGVSDTAREGIFRTDGTTASRVFYWPFPADCFGKQLSLMFSAIEPGSSATLHNQIAYTNVASDAQPTTQNAFFPLPNFSSPITWTYPIEPSDLVVAKSLAGFVLVQGDVTNPIQRQISFAHAVSTTRPVNTDAGLAISVSRDSVYLWTGSELRDIGYQLLGNPTEPPFYGSKDAVGFETDRFNILDEPSFRIASWGQNGQMGFGEYFLFAGNDYLWDERTECWFKTSRPGRPEEAVPARFAADRLNGRIYQARHMSLQTGRQLLWWERLAETEYHRSTSYSFTLPLIYTDHGFTQLRELEFYLGLFAAESTVEVSFQYADHEGNVRTHVVAPVSVSAPSTAAPSTVGNTADVERSYASRKALSANVRIGDLPGISAQWFKITCTLRSKSSAEAPMLEKVLVGTAPLSGKLKRGNT